jgi:hypothetical protein
MDIHYVVDRSNIWVSLDHEVLAARARISLLIALAIGLMLAPPAQADELVVLDSVESSIEAAGELVQMPTEPDWGVPDPATSLPAVPQDAPEVPAAPIEAPQEIRYHVQGPQYHAEYQAPAADPAPPPAPTPAPAATPTAPPAEAAPEAEAAPSTPVPAEVPTPVSTPVEAPSAPTIWIWVWNWTSIEGGEERYQNSEIRYQIDDSLLEDDLTEIVQSIEAQIPVRIDVKTGMEITEEILPKVIPGHAPEQDLEPVIAREPESAPPATSKPRSKTTRTFAPRPIGLERAVDPPLAVSGVGLTQLPHARRGGREKTERKTPRASRPTRGTSELPRPGERFADSAAASGGAASSVLKTIAILALSLLLAAFGHGRRIWLPVSRWRGLLGSRTDPPG